jgi:Icc-related predicted phosphoesterase
MIKLVVISDTHGFHRQMVVPEGDILIHAGDFTDYGTLEQAADFNLWLGQLPHPHKIVIAGNHDFCFESNPQEAKAQLTNGIYLQDQAIEIMGIKFYGSPWTPVFFDWAFMANPGPQMAEIWSKVPKDIDVLITHGPPKGICDLTDQGDSAGCQELLAALNTVKPKYHIFGHIHEGRGIKKNNGITFLNASNIDSNYQKLSPAVVLNI